MNSPGRFFIYCRKSRKDDEGQVLSIPAQFAEIDELARKDNLNVLDRLHEEESAKEPGRKVFNEMLRRIEAGEADGILCWALNRLARNFDDGGKIIGLLQRGVIKQIRTIERTHLPTDNVLMIAVELGMANQYVRDLSRDIQRGIREKVRQGVYSGKAPTGYYNEPKLRTIEPHPQNFAKLKRILELFATEDYSLTAIQRELAASGIVGERSKKPLHLSTIVNLFRNPFYYGVFMHKGEMHKGAHVPMISKETFDAVQKALIAVGKPRKRRGDKGFLFLDFATCQSCGYCVTAERHVKKSGLIFSYYRCTHKNKRTACHERAFLRQERFAEEVVRNVELVTLPDEWKEKYLARMETWEANTNIAAQAQIDRLEAELTGIKASLKRINTAFSEGHLDIEEFKELKNPLVPKKVSLEKDLTKLAMTKTSRLELLKHWIFEANMPKNLVISKDWFEMKSLLKKIGSNRLLSGQTLTVSFKKPWNLLAETTIAARSAASEDERNLKWWRRRELNPGPWQENQP
jgi:site-specific DNA recombinase